MGKTFLILILCLLKIGSLSAQSATSPKNNEAGILLEQIEKKYNSAASVSADFSLSIQRPKLKAAESSKEEVMQGKLMLKGKKFKISVNDQLLICDGENLWTYIPTAKEVQISAYEESDEVFSPARIFSQYKSRFQYQIKERKVWNGKAVTVIELAPLDKKAAFFKVDLGLDDANRQILEFKVYDKSGIRYTYTIKTQSLDQILPDQQFTFDARKYPGVEVVDLR
jgi:outer membrane lipoprotein-sorting protein